MTPLPKGEANIQENPPISVDFLYYFTFFVDFEYKVCYNKSTKSRDGITFLCYNKIALERRSDMSESRAFTKFHGASPSAYRMGGMDIRTFAPIKINKTSSKEKTMDYRIVEKAAFTVVGFGKRFAGETAYTEIPRFWDEHYENGRGKIIEGMFGVCLDGDCEGFEYLIADMYLPWKDIPDGCVTKTIDAATWAVFPWSGECPEALQTVNTWIWSEWLPNSQEYELSANCNLEVYLSMEHGEIWLPVKKK
jgi:AraC family transcriptional regulator